MHRCHTCGKNIPDGQSVFRVIKTGSYSEGGDYTREVVLCPRCDEMRSHSEQMESTKKRLLLAGGVVAVIGLGVYWYFFKR